MKEVLIVLFCLGVLAGFRAMIRGFRRRRFFRVFGSAISVLTILWLGWLLGLTRTSADVSYEQTRKIFGLGVVLQPARLVYSSWGLTDGYGIAVHDAPDELLQWVSSSPPEFTTKYPMLSSVQSSWTRVGWRPTPISTDDEMFLSSALYDSAPNKDLHQATALLRQLAREPGHYFAYLHTTRFGRPENLSFFLISPEKRVYISVHSSI